MNFYLILKRIFLILIFANLAGCSSNNDQPHKADNSNLTHQQKIKLLEKFDVSGSFYYKLKNTKYYGRFYLNQTNSTNYALKFTTTFGTTMFNLKVNKSKIELIDYEGNRHTDNDVNRLMYRLTGMNFPFANLHDWIKADFEHLPTQKRDDAGKLINTVIAQKNTDKNWHIAITRYLSHQLKNFNVQLPEVITVNSNDETEYLRLTLKEWQF